MIEVIRGDITTMEVDAIVNAANTSLLGGGGVDGAIHKAGGPAILEACKEIRKKQGGCPAGQAVITTAGKLPARFVIHTVGPIWNGKPEEERLLAAAYRNSLQLAKEQGLASVAFPNISTGVYRFPKPKAAAIAVSTVKAFLETDSTIKRVVFVCFDEENYSLYKDLL
ncbi:MAG TPA: O-acetyl-ADP-ribose deacetylase, partial [Flavisolibacter sp.]|nr:O-acetyl-ADP-ribose deacetylase [Flavisolibacter sp.]